MKNILITGGAGFIGSHLVERLVSDKRNFVCVIDNLSTGRLKNLNAVSGFKNFKFIKGDILDSQVFNKISTPEVIFHLAAAVGAKLVIEKPLNSFRTNIIGTENVLNFALKSRAKIVITSSSEVYGQNTRIPFKETDSRIYGSVYNLRWGYALSKASDELMAICYYREHHLSSIVVRLFNTVGPRQTGEYGMVVPTLIKQALKAIPLTIYGNGSQIRSFTDVRDVVSALIKLTKEPRAVGKVFNIGSESSISIKKLGQLIIKLTASKSKLKFIPHDLAYGKNFEEMMKRKPDITEIKKIISYRPITDLVKILKPIIEEIER